MAIDSIDSIAFTDHQDPVYKAVLGVQSVESLSPNVLTLTFTPHTSPLIAMTKQVVFSEEANPPLPFYCEYTCQVLVLNKRYSDEG